MALVNAWRLLCRAWAGGLALDPLLQVSEWADANRQLSRKAAAETGDWSTARTPYLRELMDCLSATSTVQDVVFVAGTQVGKSETGLNWLGYAIDCAPGPFLVVMPTLGLARRWSRQRFADLINNTVAIKAKAGEKRSRDSANTILEKEFAGEAIVVVTGANSAAGLRSMPIRYIHFDEVDAYPADVDGEGDPIGLARNRQDTFGLRAKRLYTSTPTHKDASEIEFRYLASDRRRYYVRCPHCGFEQPLVWADGDGRRRMHWVNDDPDTAAYICAGPECGALIEERHKFDMLAAGRWIAEAPGPGKAAGFLLNSLYSPWMRWPALVQEFMEAEAARANGDYEKLKKFVNTRLAQTWERPGESIKAHALQDRAKAETYRLATVPPGGLVLTASVDVQPDRLELLIVAWGIREELWIVDYRVVYGDTNEDEPWTQMREIVRTPVRNAWGRDLYVRACAVDTGYNAQRCYAWLREHAHEGFFGVKGFGDEKRPVLGKRSAQDFNWQGVKVENGAYIYPVGTFAAKEQLTGWLKLEGRGTHRVHFSPELPADFFDQLTAERLVTRWVGGKAKREWWKPKTARNEALDLMVYNMAAASFIALPRWRAIQWETLQANLERDDLFLQADRGERMDHADQVALPEAVPVVDHEAIPAGPANASASHAATAPPVPASQAIPPPERTTAAPGRASSPQQPVASAAPAILPAPSASAVRLARTAVRRVGRSLYLKRR
ncbi:phage terminase large subunit family protein [Paraburkholderia terricola]|uniref:Phage terminase, large subunit GpA n=1 Tax=Paraburkholderia terricola TaxID=169427 RepID=A0A1M6XMQ8_9BURK|nr:MULTISPECIES: phage terminase large subunit family protein [Paraburkholderia]SDP29708.1 Phage terminase, large subunit GpA [Paraburkholderia sediminicola]SHL07075.1 Phage terminase, large subunit GpA [Paraburkholderia terricola]